MTAGKTRTPECPARWVSFSELLGGGALWQNPSCNELSVFVDDVTVEHNLGVLAEIGD
jgi:hypothetical protein